MGGGGIRTWEREVLGHGRGREASGHGRGGIRTWEVLGHGRGRHQDMGVGGIRTYTHMYVHTYTHHIHIHIYPSNPH